MKAPSIRAYILGVVLAGVVLPLAVVGWTVTSGGVRSGEELLGAQLAASVDNLADAIERRWEFHRGDLLMLGSNDIARRALRGETLSAADSQFMNVATASVDRSIVSVALYDAYGRQVWRAAPRVERGGPAASGGVAQRQLAVSLPIEGSDAPVGRIEASLLVTGIIPIDSARLTVPGSEIAVRETTTSRMLVLPRSMLEFPQAGRITVDEKPWLVRTRRVASLPIEIAVAARSTPYTAPFEKARRSGVIALIVVTVLAIILTLLLTGFLGRSVDSLVNGTEALARGDLTRRVSGERPAELGRLAQSFNTMAESLQSTLGELTERKSLAAVGEFAASLSHEVRNALTAVHVDLERAAEHVDDDTGGALVRRALGNVRRLDAAVTGALQISRSGKTTTKPVDLRSVIAGAMQSAQPAIGAQRGSIELLWDGDDEMKLCGDADALRHLLLNLLLNSAQAIPAGGSITVKVGRQEPDSIRVSVIDNGRGIPSMNLERVAKPFFTTRTGGTGLGLPISRQIAESHGGTLTIQSEEGLGTSVHVSLPCSPV